MYADLKTHNQKEKSKDRRARFGMEPFKKINSKDRTADMGALPVTGRIARDGARPELATLTLPVPLWGTG